MLALVTAASDGLGVHDAATFGTVADRRITTAMIHVLARVGPPAGWHIGSPHGRAPGFAAAGRFAAGREWSAIRNVARETVTTFLQRGHVGFMLLPLTPSRYESEALQ